MNNGLWMTQYRLFPSPPAFRLRTVVYGCRGVFVVTPAFRLGFVMTTDGL